MVKSEEKLQEWSLSVVGGGKATKVGSSFSLDNKYFIQPFTNSIKVYYISTRQCVKTIPNINLESFVASKIDPLRPGLIWLFKSNGQIVIVNWKDRGSDQIIHTIEPLKDLKNVNDVTGFRFNYSLNSYEVLVLLGKLSTKSNSGHKKSLQKIIIRVNENVNKENVNFKKINIEIKELLSFKKVLKYSQSLNSKNLLFLIESTINEEPVLELKLIELKSFNIHNTQTLTLSRRLKISALTVSNNNLVAIGLHTGWVEIVYNFINSSESNNSDSPKVLKWHISPVSALCFTKDNNYLLSGGKEKVLVFWQVGTDKLQFLPRLNGQVSQISTNYFSPDIDSTKNNNNDGIDYYVLTLDLENTNNNDFEVLILNSIELTSRVSITNIRLNTKNPIMGINKEIKKIDINKNQNIFKIKSDYTLSGNAEINSSDKNLYLLNGSEIQVFNLLKNEQFFSLNVIPKISMGKVKSELELKDPKVNLFNFTKDGNWLATFDEQEAPDIDNLISKGEISYSLKFWKKTNINSDDGSNEMSWELATKVVDPHGEKTKIVKLIPAPISYFRGEAMLTVDNKGGIRLWRPQQPKLSYSVAKVNKTQLTAWTLRRFVSSLINSKTASVNDVAVDWSKDGTLILLSFGNTIYQIPANNFDDWSYLNYDKKLINSANIKYLKLINDDSNLILISEDCLLNYSLIEDTVLYEYKIDFSKLSFNENLISFDLINEKFTLGLNYLEKTEEKSIVKKSLIITFNFENNKPVSFTRYFGYLVSIRSIPNSEAFVCLDDTYNILLLNEKSKTPNKILSLSTVLNDTTVNTNQEDYLNEMVSLVQTNKPINFSKKIQSTKDTDGDIDMLDDDSDNFWYGKKINNHTFDSVLSSNLENIDMEDLFNAVVECI